MNLNKKIEESLSVLNDKDLNNSSFVNIEQLEYAMDKKLYGVLDALFYLIKVEYIFEINKNYELLLPVVKKYYKENNLDIKVNNAKIYNSFDDFLSLGELDVFYKNSTIEKTLNNRISLISNCNADLLYKKQYTEILSDYIKKINPFENNKVIKENKKSLSKKNVILNISFIICLISFLWMYLSVSAPNDLLKYIKIPSENLTFLFENYAFNLAKLLLMLSAANVFLWAFKNSLIRNVMIFLLMFFSLSTLEELTYQIRTITDTPKKEIVTFDKVSILNEVKSNVPIKQGFIKIDDYKTKNYIWPESVIIKKGVKYEVEYYNNLIVNATEIIEEKTEVKTEIKNQTNNTPQVEVTETTSNTSENSIN